MGEWLFQYYLFIKAMHIISIIAWTAGMLYLPRLFVYHVDAKTGSDKSETFKIMERRLLRAIINPAMIAAWVFGLLMLWANPTLMQAGWMHMKLGCVFFMTGFHYMLIKWRKEFNQDKNKHSAKFFRLWNEVPAFLMVIIVIMAVIEPF